jgi:thiamine-monophosphate kinase
MAVTITVLGETPGGQSVYRAGARVGDEVWVTGTLGGAKAGLEVLRQPGTMAGLPTEGVLARYRRPHPRLHEAQYLRQQASLHSLLDISDGLSSDLRHVCAASGVGARLEAVDIPIDEEARQVAAALQLDPLALALHGGEDFELCFTVPPGGLRDIQHAFQQRFHCPLTQVGVIQAGNDVMLGLPDGTAASLPARGYDHFRSP